MTKTTSIEDPQPRRKSRAKCLDDKSDHQPVFVNIFNLPIACDGCDSFVWPMENGLVCKLCRTTCHKKCFQKIENACTGKQKRKQKIIRSTIPLPQPVQPSQPSGRIFRDPDDFLLSHGEKNLSLADELITVIEREGGSIEGIYRLSGRHTGIRELRLAIKNSERIDWSQYHDSDIHIVASTFKTLLQEMPESLMTFERYEEIANIVENDHDEEQLQNVYVSIEKIPKSNYDLLKLLFSHLARIAQHSAENRMNAESLAILFAPVLFRADFDPCTFDESRNDRATRYLKYLIDAKLQKLKSSVDSSNQADSAAVTANTHLSGTYSSKVFVEVDTSGLGEAPDIPETIPNVDEEEVRLLTENESLRRKREKRTRNLTSLTVSNSFTKDTSV